MHSTTAVGVDGVDRDRFGYRGSQRKFAVHAVAHQARTRDLHVIDGNTKPPITAMVTLEEGNFSEHVGIRPRNRNFNDDRSKANSIHF